ncbi:CRISPR-associated endoribonuclease Cas2 1 [Alicyclobacillus cellulosilyticus]|uniref:CRISPR-associated endoribonuclease Cas2 n=1 Tax=Alicyclobacillus cellulosilyticus TaxID=1003997 RepID=A0A917K7W0_9BACL|nr:CRISPR-associated endonuclease Cas2 [Alicyclobacillus cellulosilyticus]GGJ03912.1 CRISPR-associated endoribonuclease Cas2 1 [Alicyclobacillus cellulosilyticus]
MYYVVTYDICTDTKPGQKRLRRIAQICVNHGQRVQKSVFECKLDDTQYIQLVAQLRDTIRPDEDSVRIYRVQDFSRKTLVSLGREVGIDFDAPWIV